MDDVRNTDNAWVETEAINTHDDSGVFSTAKLMQQSNDPGKTSLFPKICAHLRHAACRHASRAFINERPGKCTRRR